MHLIQGGYKGVQNAVCAFGYEAMGLPSYNTECQANKTWSNAGNCSGTVQSTTATAIQNYLFYSVDFQ